MMHRALLLVVAASVCHAADTTPDGPRKVVRDSLANLQKSDQKIRNYSFQISLVNRETDSHGVSKTRSRVVSREFVDGLTVTRLISRDGVPLTEEERRKNEEQLQKHLADLKGQSAAQRAKEAEQRRKGRNNQEEWYKEAPEALDFKWAGQETIEGRPAMVLTFSPHPGFQPANIWARVFLKMSGKVWIDSEETELVKAEAGLFDDVTIGWGLVGRVNRGTAFTLDRERVAAQTWLPRKQSNRYSARLLLKTIRGDETLEFSGYTPQAHPTH